MGRLKIYAILGLCPYEQLDVPMVFSPIDETAKAILKLCETPCECVMFHPYSHNTTLSANVFKAMTNSGLTIKPVEREEFEFALMYYDAFSISDDFFNWFSRGAILFGLLSNRFDAKEREYMLDVIDTLGGYEEYEKMSKVLVEADDAAIIEALAANKCLAN